MACSCELTSGSSTPSSTGPSAGRSLESGPTRGRERVRRGITIQRRRHLPLNIAHYDIDKRDGTRAGTATVRASDVGAYQPEDSPMMARFRPPPRVMRVCPVFSSLSLLLRHPRPCAAGATAAPPPDPLVRMNRRSTLTRKVWPASSSPGEQLAPRNRAARQRRRRARDSIHRPGSWSTGPS
jgi:hypothetical protein